jgi:CRISPR associated protein Cas1
MPLTVDHDALIAKEGLTHYPQTPARHVLYRGVHGAERIILLAPSGSLSFDAIRWCQEQGITAMIVERDGQLLACLTPEQPGDLSLCRRQYMASATGRDMAVAQWLVRCKIQGHGVSEGVRQLRGRPCLFWLLSALFALTASLTVYYLAVRWS